MSNVNIAQSRLNTLGGRAEIAGPPFESRDTKGVNGEGIRRMLPFQRIMGVGSVIPSPGPKMVLVHSQLERTHDGNTITSVGMSLCSGVPERLEPWDNGHIDLVLSITAAITSPPQFYNMC